MDLNPLITLNAVNRKRLTVMIKSLIPGAKFIRITASGMVIMRKKWFSLFGKRLHITDLCLNQIPSILSRMAKDKKMGDKYHVLIQNYLDNTVALKTFYGKETDIVGFLWTHYNRIYVDVPIVQKADPLPLTGGNGNYVPSITFFNKIRISFIGILDKEFEKSESVYDKVRKILQQKEPSYTLQKLFGIGLKSLPA